MAKQFGMAQEVASEFIGEPILVDVKRAAALLPRPTQPGHANYPPQITFWFYLYGRVFVVSHSFRRGRRKGDAEIEEFIISIDPKLSYFKIKRVEALCREAVDSHLGADYFGHKFEVISKLVVVNKGVKDESA